MKKTPFASLFSCLSLVALLLASCGSPTRYLGNGAGSGGEGDVATSGATFTAGDGGTGGKGTMHSAGAGAVSMSGGDAGDSSSGAGGSGASAGAPGTPECTARQKLCEGVCVEIDNPAYGCGPTLCSSAGCPDASGAALVCDAGQCVLGSCGTGNKKCDGHCVSVTDPAYGCGAATCDASTCPSQGTGATVVCDGSACVIGSCPAAYKKCGSKCVAISDPTYGCGATTCDATGCPSAGTGTLVCQNSTCVVGTCGPGTKKCGTKCVTTDANNGCADATRCTACAGNEACTGTPTTCQCVPTPMATVCTGKCGSISNGCGGTYTCGACTSPQSCAGAGTPNVCGCTKTAMTTACLNKTCGSVPDGCGGTYTCGMCSSPSPSCVSNSCKQCSSVADCPSGTFSCTNNSCACRVPNSSNVIKDGGFDNASVLKSWTSTGAVWTNSDADACPGSGSVTVATGDSVSRCFQIPRVPPGETDYAFGFRYKGGDGGCVGGSFQDSNCTQGGSFLINMTYDASASWALATYLATAVPEGTSSISVQCQNGSVLTIDQMYLRVSGFTGSGF